MMGKGKGLEMAREKSAKGMAKKAEKKPAYAKGGYAGKTAMEAKMCKPTAAKAGASYKGGK